MAYPNPRSHNALLILRGIAILSILWFHISPKNLSLPPIFGHNVSFLLFIDGMTPVWILLILSGYLMGKKMLSKGGSFGFSSVLSFYTNRISKIFPAYYLVLFLSLVLLETPPFQNKEGILRFVTFRATQESFPYALNNLWFISLIVQCYLLFPFIFAFTQYLYKKSFRLIVFIASVFPILSVLFRLFMFNSLTQLDPVQWTLVFHKQTFVVIDLFIMGILLNYLLLYVRNSTVFSRWKKQWLMMLSVMSVIGAMALAAYSLFLFVYDFPRVAFFYAVLLPALFMVCIGAYIVIFEWYEFKTPSIPTRGVGAFMHPYTILAWIGTLSYELYLVHSPIEIASIKSGRYSLLCTSGCTFPLFLSHYGLLVLFSLLAAWTIKTVVSVRRYFVVGRVHTHRNT